MLGEQSKDLIIINTVVPFLYTYGLHKADEGMCERAGRFLEELKAENNHIIRSWSDAGLPVASAADSQALIQLQKNIVINVNVCIVVSDMNICGRSKFLLLLQFLIDCI